MQFNYAKERKKFDEDWKKMRVEYRVAGMSEEDIQIMYEFDLMAFRQRRTYCLHNESQEEMEEKQNSVYLKSVYFEKLDYEGKEKNSWLDEIENEKLYTSIQQMKEIDIEILTLWAIEKYSMTEIAKLKNVSQHAISKRISKIVKNQKNILNQKDK